MLTPEQLDRLEARLERWSGPENPSLPVNYCFELLALARKGLEAERLEREAGRLRGERIAVRPPQPTYCREG